MFEWAYGSTQAGAAFLALVALVLALILLRRAVQDGAWKLFCAVLILYSIREFLQALDTFGIATYPAATYLVTLVMLVILALSVVLRMLRQGGVRA